MLPPDLPAKQDPPFTDNMAFLGLSKDLGLMLGIKMLHRTRSSWLVANYY